MNISFHYQNEGFRLAQARLRKVFFQSALLQSLGRNGRVTVVFCTDDHLLTLNQQFLQHDYLTDILTFNLSTDTDLIAEIYISVHRVKENATSLKVPFRQEIDRVMAHGILHLLGHQDNTPSEIQLMRSAEDHLIKELQFFVSRETTQ